MLTSRAYALRSGTEVRLAVAPRDPRSLMRGDYSELNYTIAHFSNARLPTEPSQCNGKPVCSVIGLAAYVTLAPNADGVAEARGIDTVPPPAGTLFIKGKFRDGRYDPKPYCGCLPAPSLTASSNGSVRRAYRPRSTERGRGR